MLSPLHCFNMLSSFQKLPTLAFFPLLAPLTGKYLLFVFCFLVLKSRGLCGECRRHVLFDVHLGLPSLASCRAIGLLALFANHSRYRHSSWTTQHMVSLNFCFHVSRRSQRPPLHTPYGFHQLPRNGIWRLKWLLPSYVPSWMVALRQLERLKLRR